MCHHKPPLRRHVHRRQLYATLTRIATFFRVVPRAFVVVCTLRFFYRHSSAINSFFVFTHFFIELHFIKRALFPFLLSKSEFLEAKSARSACARLAKRKSAKSRVTCNSLQLFILPTTALPLSLSHRSHLARSFLNPFSIIVMIPCNTFAAYYPFSVFIRVYLLDRGSVQQQYAAGFYHMILSFAFTLPNSSHSHTNTNTQLNGIAIGQYNRTPIPLQRHL